MPAKSRKKKYYKGAIYHLYNRGVNGVEIFLSAMDYRVYWKYLKESLAQFAVTLFSYNLMPNHIHLQARQESDIPVSNFIHRVHYKYATYFNKQHNRYGPLFQDRFKAKIVDDAYYIIRLSKYIHLNPVLAGLVKNPADWSYSSYPFYIGQREYDICDKEFITNTYLSGSAELYKKFVEEDMMEILKLKQDKKFQELIFE